MQQSQSLVIICLKRQLQLSNSYWNQLGVPHLPERYQAFPHKVFLKYPGTQMIATHFKHHLDIPSVEYASCCFQSHFPLELLFFQVCSLRFSSRLSAALSRLSQNLISGQFTVSSKYTVKIINALLPMISQCHTKLNASPHPQISSFSYSLLFSTGLNLQTCMCKQRLGQTPKRLSSQ